MAIRVFSRFRRRGASGVEAAPAASEPAPKAPGEAERESLRSEHQVRCVGGPEEGLGVHRLPNGVYGFTYTPGLPDAPLFATKSHYSFELHKLPDGELHIVGFLAPETAGKVEAGEEALRIRLLPDAQGEAAAIASIPVSRVTRVREYSSRDGKGLELQIAASGEKVTPLVRYDRASAS